VVIATLIKSRSQAVEPVEVQLTLEAGHLGLLEILGHDVIDEFLGLVNHEAASVRLPRDDVSKAVGFNAVEHLVELDGEGRDDTSLGLVLDFRGIDGGVSGVVVVVVLDHVGMVGILAMNGELLLQLLRLRSGGGHGLKVVLLEVIMVLASAGPRPGRLHGSMGGSFAGGSR